MAQTANSSSIVTFSQFGTMLKNENGEKMKNINEKELHELFCRLKKKEKNAYEELYKKYSSLVYKIAFSILKDKENAEDIM